ncbi:hypothetical protein ABZY31_28350 [Streptomyces sp. NPDC006529]|uniref:hypothetical protein n=1 Tax=Streptomyces sp. NPDC006529 TaxID=3157177 RepID=UPI00339F7813
MSSTRVTELQQPVRSTQSRSMSSPEQSKSPTTRSTASLGSAATRSRTTST